MEKVIYNLFLLVLVLAGLGALALTTLPIPGGVELRIVESGSMEPAITTGSVVVVRASDSYTAGDIITFTTGNRSDTVVTHRVISDRVQAGEPYYTTRGDANPTADTTEIPHEDVIGKVLFSVPTLGYVFDFARQPLGFVLLVGIPAAFVILEESMALWRYARAPKSKNGTHDTV